MSTNSQHAIETDDRVAPDNAFDLALWENAECCNHCLSRVKHVHTDTVGMAYRDVEDHRRTPGAIRDHDEEIPVARSEWAVEKAEKVIVDEHCTPRWRADVTIADNDVQDIRLATRSTSRTSPVGRHLLHITVREKRCYAASPASFASHSATIISANSRGLCS